MLDAAHSLGIIATERECSRSRVAALPSGRRPTWHVVAAYPKAERRAHAALHLKGFEAFLPTLTVRWVDRSWHTGPLFPGYLFCRLDLSKPWHPVTRCPGVFCLLSTDGIPTPCPDAVVSVLQATEAERATPAPARALWAPGMPCSLATGAFQGHQAVVTSVSRDTANVAVMMFGALREVSVQLDCLTRRDDA